MTRSNTTTHSTTRTLVLAVALIVAGYAATRAHADEPCGAEYRSVELGGLVARVPVTAPTFGAEPARPYRTVELGGLAARVPARPAALAESCPEPTDAGALAQRAAVPAAYSRASLGMP